MARPQIVVDIAFASNPAATPVWTPVSQYVRAVSIRRGRQRELGRIEAGTATVVLDNRDRRFDPTNDASPYYPNVIPMKRIRIGASYSEGALQWLFTGFIESWPQRYPGVGDAVVEVPCVDWFKLFSLYKLTIEDRVQELSGQRIIAVLEYIANVVGAGGWYWTLASSDTDPYAPYSKLQLTTRLAYAWEDQDVDAGQSEVQSQTINEIALQHLQAVAEAEQGMLFVARDGRVTFRNRHARIRPIATPPPVFGNVPGALPYNSLSIEYTDDQLWNKVIIERRGGTVPGIAEDRTSQAKYLQRTLQRSGLLITNDREAQAMAEYLVNRYANPQLVIRSMTISPEMDEALFSETFGRELGDRVLVRHRPPGPALEGQSPGPVIEQLSFVEGIAWDITPDRWQTTWQLSPADLETYWILAGTNADQYAQFSKLEQSTRVAY